MRFMPSGLLRVLLRCQCLVIFSERGGRDLLEESPMASMFVDQDYMYSDSKSAL